MLSDAEKRRKYDELGQSYQRWQQTGGGPSGFDWNQWSAAGGAAGGPGGTRVSYTDINDLFGQGGDFSDFFEAIFGGMGAAGAPGASSIPLPPVRAAKTWSTKSRFRWKRHSGARSASWRWMVGAWK